MRMLPILTIYMIKFIETKPSSDDIDVNCLSCGENNELAGEEGRNLVVQYKMSDKILHHVDIDYDYRNGTSNRIRLYHDGRVDTKYVHDHAKFVIPERAIVQNHTVMLNITLQNLSEYDDGLKFIHSYTNLVKKKVITKENAVTVYVSPSFTSELDETYSVKVGENKEVKFDIRGHPTPTVNATMGDLIFPVKVINTRSYIHTYSVTVINLTRKQCGTYLELKAENKYGAMTGRAKFAVLYTPDTPVITDARMLLPHCLVLSWSKVESGNCNVVYKIKIKIKDNGKTFDKDEIGHYYHSCQIDWKSADVTIQATVNGFSSRFSDPQNVSLSRDGDKVPIYVVIEKVPLFAVIIIGIVGIILSVVLIWMAVFISRMKRKIRENYHHTEEDPIATTIENGNTSMNLDDLNTITEQRNVEEETTPNYESLDAFNVTYEPYDAQSQSSSNYANVIEPTPDYQDLETEPAKDYYQIADTDR